MQYCGRYMCQHGADKPSRITVTLRCGVIGVLRVRFDAPTTRFVDAVVESLQGSSVWDPRALEQVKVRASGCLVPLATSAVPATDATCVCTLSAGRDQPGEEHEPGQPGASSRGQAGGPYNDLTSPPRKPTLRVYM